MPTRQRYLIVCEGEETEPNYFEAIKRVLPKNMVELIIEGEGANTLSLVARAEELSKEREQGNYPFDQVWVVFDRDSFKADAFDNAINSATSKNMKCAWSNEAFELWYILHFEYRNTAMSRDAYKSKLTDLLAEEYTKNSVNMYCRMKELGNPKQAVAYAKKLHEYFQEQKISPSKSNPCTTVYLLFEELNKYLKESEVDKK